MIDGDEGGGEEQESLYKVLVIGDFGVGKSCFIKRYVEDVFSANYKLTIGVDFALKKVERDGRQLSLQLWDIAGHERFGHMTHVYYKHAIAAVIVFDLGRPATFESVRKWQADLNQKVMLPSGDTVPTLLIANKCDTSALEIDKEKFNAFCETNGFIGWFATSAKTNTNIASAMDALVTAILALPTDGSRRPGAPHATLDQFIRLDSNSPGAKSRSTTCCDG